MVSNEDINKKFQEKKDKEQAIIEKSIKNEKKGLMKIYGNGLGNSIAMEDSGLKTGNGNFIEYSDIDLIQETTNISRENTIAFGLIGMAASAVSQKTVEIQFNGSKVLIRDIKKQDSSKFIFLVQNKIKNSKIISKNEKIDPFLKIKKAKELFDIGAISEEEFNKIKNRYLDQI
jgi:hypothetical protein